MRIKLSRHAKRRAKLYEIPESIITDILTNMNLHRGEQEIIKDVEGFKYPLKIVVSVEKDLTTVITNYPLKKGRKK
jgi:hypothetical protein